MAKFERTHNRYLLLTTVTDSSNRCRNLQPPASQCLLLYVYNEVAAPLQDMINLITVEVYMVNEGQL
jgi:hypothetical protein